MASSSDARGRARAPRLLLRVTVFTALGLTMAGAVAAVVVRHAYAVQGEQRAIERARLTTQLALARQLRPADLTGSVSRPRRRELNRFFTRWVLDSTTGAAALYTSAGAVTYSIGPIASPRLDPAAARAAETGRTSADISNGQAGRVLTTYVPIAAGRGSRGVVALVRDYGPIASAARHSALLIAGVLEGVLVALMLVLTPSLLRASRRIAEQVTTLEQLATHDELTGLPNRVGFRRALEEQIARRGATAAVLLVDLEGFHELNDTLGPDQGDALLRAVAERLRNADESRFVARLGEDEFAFLLPSADPAGLDQVQEDVRANFTEPFRVGRQRVAVDARTGCALAPRDGTDPVVLLRRAGVALSAAKRRRQAFAAYDPGDDHSDVSWLTQTAELREALQCGELTVHYQPQADLATGAIRGAEALVRWEHARRGLVSAADFIPLAEKAGLIGELGRLVLTTAARQWQQWHAQGVTIDIAVNLAAADLLDPALPDEIETLIEEHGLPPEYLVLEITERTTLRDERRTARVLERLNRIGARLAIDDYGTGYSSLAHLRNFHARQIKLDRSFTAHIPGDPADEAIVRSTIELGHSLGATIVAEGIETRAQWTFLAGVGCDIAQGFLIGWPVTGDEFARVFANHHPLRGVA